ncbi:hydantoinase/oxoprolinase family protein [Sphingomonas crocodyli]|uniref:Hydantoinase/oxoprolinase family protein n=2 Tax=Sphingomonas crocodyli TaxID=1979270 RepID=A0A437MBL3_9SPHN|nr:hydantoinase/oxoprolinase family protein [Sphingomonas crocodyli]
MYRIGLDVGGTFTDFVVSDRDAGTLRFFKTPSTPSDPSEAIVEGIRQVLDLFSIAPHEVEYVGHGTTVATNMIIERRGVKTGLLTTQGFRDVLAIGRQTRPDLFDYSVVKPEPLIRRVHRLVVDERLDAQGQVLTPLDTDSVDAALDELARAKVEAVAICFLHSYRNPSHEQLVRDKVAARLPGVFVSISSEVLPEFREFERMSTTALNAYVGPKMKAYLDRLRTNIAASGLKVEPLTVHSNGGLLPMKTVEQLPVLTCLSGPAAGVVGAASIGRAADILDLVTFDVGGTSTDVSLITGGRPKFTSERLVAGFPVKLPMIDIHVIGAGGGSIAAVDDASALKIGPRSAGAVPGPVAFGKGGTEATLTDANIVLRRLNPTALLEGRLKVDHDAARKAIHDQIAGPLGISVDAAAYGMLRIATANMSRAIRAVSSEHGYDLAKLTLFAFGGAGPLFASDVAVECGMPQILVPQEPGTLCARGVLLSDVSRDFVRTTLFTADDLSWPRISACVSTMAQEGRDWLAFEQIPPSDRLINITLDARYLGQNHNLRVTLPGDGSGSLSLFVDAFHETHRREFGYELPEHPVEVVNCRVQAVGRLPDLPNPTLSPGISLAAAMVDERDVYFGQAGWRPTTVYHRALLPLGTPLIGPAIIDEMSSTIVLRPDQTGIADSAGNFIIKTLA